MVADFGNPAATLRKQCRSESNALIHISARERLLAELGFENIGDFWNTVRTANQNDVVDVFREQIDADKSRFSHKKRRVESVLKMEV